MKSVLDRIRESRYCFLLEIVTTSDSVKVYKVIYSNSEFTDVRIVCLLEEDIKYLTDINSVIKNFYLDDDYLRGEYFMEVNSLATAEELLYHEEFVIEPLEDNPMSLFAFLYKAYNCAMYVDPDCLEKNDNGDLMLGDLGYSHFTNINFSQSTMTCYFNMLNKEGLCNYNVVVYNEDTKTLEFKPFYYLIKPEDFDSDLKQSSEVKGTVHTRDGEEYLLAYVKFLSIYDGKPVVISKDLLNVGCYMHNMYSNSVTTLDAVINFFTDNQDSNVAWAGGTGSHKNDCSVLLESTAFYVTKKSANEIVKSIWDNYVEPLRDSNTLTEESAKEALEEILSAQLSPELLKVRALAAQVLMSSTLITDVISNAVYYRRVCREQRAKVGTYLYYVRCNAFLSKTRIIAWGDNVLRSNFTKACTIVKEGRYYGE